MNAPDLLQTPPPALPPQSPDPQPASVPAPPPGPPASPAKAEAKRRRAQRLQTLMLRLITEGAQQASELERQLASHPPPELETLLKLHRVLILQLTLNAADSSDRLTVAQELMRPLMQWAQLEEKRRAREERARRADKERKLSPEEERQQALQGDTLNLCERQLMLL